MSQRFGQRWVFAIDNDTIALWRKTKQISIPELRLRSRASLPRKNEKLVSSDLANAVGAGLEIFSPRTRRRDCSRRAIRQLDLVNGYLDSISTELWINWAQKKSRYSLRVGLCWNWNKYGGVCNPDLGPLLRQLICVSSLFLSLHSDSVHQFTIQSIAYPGLTEICEISSESVGHFTSFLLISRRVLLLYIEGHKVADSCSSTSHSIPHALSRL